MKAAAVLAAMLMCAQFAFAQGIGLAPSRLEWDGQGERTLLVLNPGTDAIDFSATATSGFSISPQNGTIAPLGSAQIQVQPTFPFQSYGRIQVTGEGMHRPAVEAELVVERTPISAITGFAVAGASAFKWPAIAIALIIGLAVIVGKSYKRRKHKQSV